MCFFVRRFTTALTFSTYNDSDDSSFATASKISAIVELAVSPSGRFLANSRDTNSARSADISNNAL